MRSKLIKMTFHDGAPLGLRSITQSFWNGKIIVCGRNSIKQLWKFSEADQPALYFLVGGTNEVYVGETDNLKNRLANHVLNKDFWHTLIACMSDELTKTEVKYLEYWFVKKLMEDGLVALQNSTKPKQPKIQEVTVDTLLDYIDTVSDILVSMNFSFIGASKEIEELAEQGTEVYCSGPSADARGAWSVNGLLVKQGSRTRIQATKTYPESSNRLRESLKKNGVIKKLNDVSYVFETDHLFSSASAAADVVLARSANGLTEWKTKEGKTIKELEQE